MARAVYRLEDANGNGPFAGDQPCVEFLQPHADPDRLLSRLGYPVEIFQALTQAGCVYGWRTLKDYRNFFYRNGRRKCLELGFKCVIYRPEFRFDLSDGQVIFLKDPWIVDMAPTFKLLLKGLAKMRPFTDDVFSLPKGRDV